MINKVKDIIKSISRSLIIFKKPRKMTKDFFLGFLKMIKLLLILFIIKLYAQKNIFKDISIKNHTYYFFNDIINVKSCDPNNVKVDENSYNNILIYYIG